MKHLQGRFYMHNHSWNNPVLICTHFRADQATEEELKYILDFYRETFMFHDVIETTIEAAGTNLLLIHKTYGGTGK